ncbi:uncharacterized protein LAESUDRAFT_738258 [Laetiporus sulphureus 93-53]|uniref:Uncharacterized protein n=1 Tax=Laetiporus sulphureus 93-53 TaxID=1314785 RepID=A0A165CSG4_9APHY|nr:uncharacterized protein LAESUDRAFT_738258 [Laetiporus sulphureus 93-53]KZT03358.1 hypothetical protein LAESUDRAFT_738258 [Laetiporus sulphureus 93-53]
MSHRLFWKLFTALAWKNWMVLSKHPWLNILQCFILPIAYGIFLAVAQLFLVKPNNYSLGTTITIPCLADHYDGSLALVWADGMNGSGSPCSTDIISHITRGFTSKHLSHVKKADSLNDVPSLCPENFNGHSKCYTAVVFNLLPGSSGNASSVVQYNYMLRNSTQAATKNMCCRCSGQ